MSSDRRDLYNGFGDTYSVAFEMVVTPLVFGLIGWFIDSRLGTFPAFALTLGLLVFGVEVWKLTRGYLHKSAEEDRKLLGKTLDD
jgi:F0F1-type ATP synthase assembly protein I